MKITLYVFYKQHIETYMTNAKIRVESIYDLALAKLLQDKLEKVVLVSPTKDQQNFYQLKTPINPMIYILEI